MVTTRDVSGCPGGTELVDCLGTFLPWPLLQLLCSSSSLVFRWHDIPTCVLDIRRQLPWSRQRYSRSSLQFPYQISDHSVPSEPYQSPWFLFRLGTHCSLHMTSVALRPSGAITCPRFLAIIVIGNIHCHERRLKSVFGGVTLLEYIYNLVEETVEINVARFLS